MEEHLHHVLRRGGGDHLLLLVGSTDIMSALGAIIFSFTWGSTDITSCIGAGLDKDRSVSSSQQERPLSASAVHVSL